MAIIPTKTPAFKITFRRGVHFQQPAVIDVAACSQILALLTKFVSLGFGFWDTLCRLNCHNKGGLTEAFQQVLLPA